MKLYKLLLTSQKGQSLLKINFSTLGTFESLACFKTII